MKPAWLPDWSGETCLVVGSGESANACTVAKFRGRCRVLVINTSYQLAPWADALYACDMRWWREYHKEVADFAGLKITQDKDAAANFKLHKVDLVDLHDPRADTILTDKRGTVGRGGFGGFQAINILVQVGVKRIPIIGFDFIGGHWHGPHPAGLVNTREQTLENWRKTFDGQAPRFAQLGVEIVNLSPISTARNYPKMTAEQVLGDDQRAAA